MLDLYMKALGMLARQPKRRREVDLPPTRRRTGTICACNGDHGDRGAGMTVRLQIGFARRLVGCPIERSKC